MTGSFPSTSAYKKKIKIKKSHSSLLMGTQTERKKVTFPRIQSLEGTRRKRKSIPSAPDSAVLGCGVRQHCAPWGHLLGFSELIPPTVTQMSSSIDPVAPFWCICGWISVCRPEADLTNSDICSIRVYRTWPRATDLFLTMRFRFLWRASPPSPSCENWEIKSTTTKGFILGSHQ